MIRPYCFCSNALRSICLYSVRLLALSWVRRVWFWLRTFEISLAMNSLVGAVLRLRWNVGPWVRVVRYLVTAYGSFLSQKAR